MNQITHFLDGSTVYGSLEETEKEVRENFGGLLKTQRSMLLPPDNSASPEECFLEGTDLRCFFAGQFTGFFFLQKSKIKNVCPKSQLNNRNKLTKFRHALVSQEY